jgi:hypothetical protein
VAAPQLWHEGSCSDAGEHPQTTHMHHSSTQRASGILCFGRGQYDLQNPACCSARLTTSTTTSASQGQADLYVWQPPSDTLVLATGLSLALVVAGGVAVKVYEWQDYRSGTRAEQREVMMSHYKQQRCGSEHIRWWSARSRKNSLSAFSRYTTRAGGLTRHGSPPEQCTGDGGVMQRHPAPRGRGGDMVVPCARRGWVLGQVGETGVVGGASRRASEGPQGHIRRTARAWPCTTQILDRPGPA